MEKILLNCSRVSLPALFLLFFLAAPAASVLASDDFGNACADALNVSANGWIDGWLETKEDRDVFRVDMAESGLLAVEVAPLNRQAGQPRLALLDGACRRMTPATAARQVAQTSASDIYFIEVSGGDAGELAYRLQSGFAAESQPTDLWLLSADGAVRWSFSAAAAAAPTPGGKACGADCVEEDPDEVEPLLPVIHLRLAAAAPGLDAHGTAAKDCEGEECEEEEDPQDACGADCVEEDPDEVEPLLPPPPVTADKACGQDCVEEDPDEVEPLLPDLEIDLLAPALARGQDAAEPLVADAPGVLAVQLVNGGGKRAVSRPGYTTLRAGAWRVASELRAGEASPRVWARLYRVCPQLLGDDHGESFGCSTALTVGERVAGEIRHGAIDDRDAFAFDLGERRTVVLATDGHVDTFGALYDARGALVAADDDGGDGVGFRLEVTLEPGRYYLRLTGMGGEEGIYTLATADRAAAR